MNIDYYEEKTRETAIYPDAMTGSPEAINYCMLGLAGEAGETLNKWKKVIRDDGGVLTQERANQIRKELGGVAYYFARACNEVGFDPSEVLRENLDVLFSRKERGVISGSGDNR